MSFAPVVIAAFAVLPAAALVAWVWLAMVQDEEDLRSSSGFEAMIFEA